MKFLSKVSLILLFSVSILACQTANSSDEKTNTSPETENPDSPKLEKATEPTADLTEKTVAPEEETKSQETPSAPAKTVSLKEEKKPVKQVVEESKPLVNPEKEKPMVKEVLVEQKEEMPIEKPSIEKTPTVETPVVEEIKKPEAPKPAEVSHEVWDQLTRKYVSASGNVNYSGLKAEKAKIEGYLAMLSKNPPQSDWGRAKTMAFWINAYNAFTVKLILDNHPVKSILNLEGGKIWFTKKLKIGDNSYTLDHIEKKLLIARYKDARVHFAVNCAAKSCPKLLNKAFTAANLESSMDKLTRAYINNSTFNKISSSKIELSQIFEWYAADFGDVKSFINKYTEADVSGASISYVPYNWDLNGN